MPINKQSLTLKHFAMLIDGMLSLRQHRADY